MYEKSKWISVKKEINSYLECDMIIHARNRLNELIKECGWE